MFRFAIRDVLWLTVVVGLGCGWWIHAARLANQNKALERRFAGVIELVTSTGLIEITKTKSGGYFVDTGQVAKDLWKRVGEPPPAAEPKP